MVLVHCDIKDKIFNKRKSLNPLADNELEGIREIKFFDEYDQMEMNNGGSS